MREIRLLILALLAAVCVSSAAMALDYEAVRQKAMRGKLEPAPNRGPGVVFVSDRRTKKIISRVTSQARHTPANSGSCILRFQNIYSLRKNLHGLNYQAKVTAGSDSTLSNEALESEGYGCEDSGYYYKVFLKEGKLMLRKYVDGMEYDVGKPRELWRLPLARGEKIYKIGVKISLSPAGEPWAVDLSKNPLIW